MAERPKFPEIQQAMSLWHVTRPEAHYEPLALQVHTSPEIYEEFEERANQATLGDVFVVTESGIVPGWRELCLHLDHRGLVKSPQAQQMALAAVSILAAATPELDYGTPRASDYAQRLRLRIDPDAHTIEARATSATVSEWLKDIDRMLVMSDAVVEAKHAMRTANKRLVHPATGSDRFLEFMPPTGPDNPDAVIALGEPWAVRIQSDARHWLESASEVAYKVGEDGEVIETNISERGELRIYTPHSLGEASYALAAIAGLAALTQDRQARRR